MNRLLSAHWAWRMGGSLLLIGVLLVGCTTSSITAKPTKPVMGATTATMTPIVVTPNTTPVPSTVIGTFRIMHMLDTLHGWASAGDVLARTSDGGQTWYDVTPPFPRTPATNMLLAGAFLSVTHTWVAAIVGNGILVFRTTEGGRSWQSATISVPASDTPQEASVQFTDTQHGWVTVDEGGVGTQRLILSLYRSTDGGATWTQVMVTDATPTALPSMGMPAITFVNATIGWATGHLKGHAYLYKTTDGGTTWNAQSVDATIGTGDLALASPTFLDAQHGVLPVFDAFARTTTCYTTTDGGVTWNATTPFNAQNGTIDILDMTHWWKTDEASVHLFETTDGGTHWTIFSPAAPYGKGEAIDFVSASTGWALGTSGLLRTTDGGQTWTVLAAAPAS